MSDQTKKYLHCLEFAAVAAAMPIVLGWLTDTPTDWKTAVKSLGSAIIIGVWTFLRANPPIPVTSVPINPVTPPPTS